MPPVYRILEVALYSLLNFLPHMVLALLPFRRKFRFSVSITCLLVALVTVVQIVLGCTAAFTRLPNGILSLLSTALYAAFYFTAVKTNFGKQLFTLLILSNMANCIVITAKCMEGFLFGSAIAHETYRFTYSICMIILHLLTTLPLSFYFRGYYSDGINKTVADSAWKYLWLIPATFYLTWFHHTYDRPISALEIALNPDHALFLLAINLGAFLVYHTVIRMINAQSKSIDLEKHNHQLTLQNLQYENLQERINEARQAKHDIRHHIIIMDRYLQTGEYDKLKEYLSNFKKSLPDDSRISFCGHDVINALLLYFAQQAKNHKVDFDVVITDIPRDIRIPDAALTVVLGNLLENALEACNNITDRPRAIQIKGKATGDSLFFYIKNTYNDHTVRDSQNRYLPTKHKGRGLGLASVRNIVKQYDGILEIEETDGMFAVSVFLNIPS